MSEGRLKHGAFRVAGATGRPRRATPTRPDGASEEMRHLYRPREDESTFE
ncbi:hypothetical protein [Haloglomus halophilum]|nr:hypothetical protein [Haloglomus halophilum]